MDKKSAKVIILTIVIIVQLVLVTISNAADGQYRFMHNDHDALVIGKISEINGGSTTIEVTTRIISSKDLNRNDPKKQLDLKTVTVKGLEQYMYFNDSGPQNIFNPKVGDFILVSIVKNVFSFKVSWGAYLVNSLDYKSLSVMIPSDSSEGIKMDVASINAFVNSNGNLTEFFFDGTSGIVGVREDNTDISNESQKRTRVVFDAKSSKTVAGSLSGTIIIANPQNDQTEKTTDTAILVLEKSPLEDYIIFTVITGGVVFIGWKIRSRVLKNEKENEWQRNREYLGSTNKDIKRLF